MSVDLTGFDKVRARLERLAAEVPSEVARALYEEASIEMKESMRRTPVDTGAARASHSLAQPKQSGRDISVSIEVGGSALGYVVPLHERVEVDHAVGQAKFLQSTIEESAPFMPERISKRIDLNRLVRG